MDLCLSALDLDTTRGGLGEHCPFDIAPTIASCGGNVLGAFRFGLLSVTLTGGRPSKPVAAA